MNSAPASVMQPGFPGNRRLACACALLLFAATFAAYWPATSADFIWDDDDYVAENETLRSVDGLRRIWFEMGAVPQYYPLVHTSYWIEYRLWGGPDPSRGGLPNPRGYHVTNIVLHGLNALLLWLLLRRLGLPGAPLAAAVFALHPVHVESVAWITERKNVLSGFFYLAGALALVRCFGVHRSRGAPGGDGEAPRRRVIRPEFVYYLLALLFYLCALWSKTVTSSLPAAALVVLWWKRGRIPWREAAELLPFFVVGVFMGLQTAWMEKARVGATGTDWDWTFAERCLIAGRAVWFYAGKIVWPVNLAFIYPKWAISTGQAWQYLFPATFLAVVAFLSALRGRIGRGPLAAVLLFAGTLFPALGFFNVFPMRYSFVADHFQYLASIALIVLIAAALSAAGPVRRFGIVLCIVLPAVLGVLTWRQARAYANYYTIWLDTVSKNPGSVLARTCLASVYVSEGRTTEALEQYEESVRIAPMDAVSLFNLGKLQLDQGRIAEAEATLRRSIEAEPRCAHCYSFLAIALSRQEKTAEALHAFAQSIILDESDPFAQFNYAITLQMAGNLEKAGRHFEAALRVNSNWPEAHLALGDVLMMQRRPAEAEPHFQEALRLRPGWDEVLMRLQAMRDMARTRR